MVSQKGLGKMVLIIALAVVVVLGGIGFVAFKGKGEKKSAKHEKMPTFEMALGDFVVNLADTNQVRYLKTTVILEVEGEAPAAGGHGGESGPDAKMRDALIQTLSSKTFAELSAPDGKDKLKEDIIEAVNERLKHSAEESEEPNKAVEVYFNEFAMQ